LEQHIYFWKKIFLIYQSLFLVAFFGPIGRGTK
jgi:hypothetical protein